MRMKKFLLSSGAVTIGAIELKCNKVNSYFERTHQNMKKYWAVYKQKQKIAASCT
jgi:hypothetical protein